MQKSLIIGILLLLFHATGFADEKLDYYTVDKQTYDLYQQGKWLELIELGGQAIEQGIDYYYLRMRLGIACNETGIFMDASRHFNKAIDFNADDALAWEYLYYAEINSGKMASARKIKQKAPVAVKLKTDSAFREKRNALNVEAGPVFSNFENKIINTDLDGPDNAYGEVTYLNDAFYLSAGAGFGAGRSFDFYLGYTNLKLSKTQKIMVDDSVTVDNPFDQHQQQFYLNSNIYPGKGFSIDFAFNYVRLRYENIVSTYNEDSASYSYATMQQAFDNYIAYISLNKDFGKIKAGIFGAYSNLNDLDQFQYGLRLTAYPFGNLDFYSETALLNHNNDGINSLILDQTFGVKLHSKLWLEIYASIGQMENYHEKSAYVVYNIPDILKLKTGGKFYWYINKSWLFTVNYLFLMREDQILRYIYDGYEGKDVFTPSNIPVTYQNHMILGGLTWKF